MNSNTMFSVGQLHTFSFKDIDHVSAMEAISNPDGSLVFTTGRNGGLHDPHRLLLSTLDCPQKRKAMGSAPAAHGPFKRPHMARAKHVGNVTLRRLQDSKKVHDQQLQAIRTSRDQKLAAQAFVSGVLASGSLQETPAYSPTSMAPFDVHAFPSNTTEFPHKVRLVHRDESGYTTFNCSTTWDNRPPISMQPSFDSIPQVSDDQTVVTWCTIALTASWGSKLFRSLHEKHNDVIVTVNERNVKRVIPLCRSLSVQVFMRAITMFICVVSDPMINVTVKLAHPFFVACVRLQMSIADLPERCDMYDISLEDCAVLTKADHTNTQDSIERWIVYRLDWNLIQRDALFDYHVQHLEQSVRPFSLQPLPGVYLQRWTAEDLDWAWFDLEILAPAMLVSMRRTRKVTTDGVLCHMLDDQEFKAAVYNFQHFHCNRVGDATERINEAVQKRWDAVIHVASKNYDTDYLLPEEQQVCPWTTAVVLARITPTKRKPRMTPRRLRFKLLFNL
jgi:hypothetical protein